MPAEKTRGLGVRNVPSLDPSEWRLVVHLRRGRLLSPLPLFLCKHIPSCNHTAEGTKVYVDGVVKATHGHAKQSVVFAVIRPIQNYDGGWNHGYVPRQYLVSLCPLAHLEEASQSCHKINKKMRLLPIL